MKAHYLAKQDRIDKHGFDLQPLFLVNVVRDGRVDTEVFRASEHELSEEDMERIRPDVTVLTWLNWPNRFVSRRGHEVKD